MYQPSKRPTGPPAAITPFLESTRILVRHARFRVKAPKWCLLTCETTSSCQRFAVEQNSSNHGDVPVRRPSVVRASPSSSHTISPSTFTPLDLLYDAASEEVRLGHARNAMIITVRPGQRWPAAENAIPSP